MKTLGSVVAIVGAMMVAGAANAATVSTVDSSGNCGDTTSPGRYVDVGGALVGGYCAYQDGNLQNADITALGLNLIEKDVVGDGNGPATSGYLQYSGSTSGTWSISSGIWDLWDHVMVGFHFGNGGGSPDSFVVELARPTTSGDWSLVALGTDRLNGLSNIYLISEVPREVPVPGTLGLLGLGLAGLGLVRRKQQA